MASISVIFTRPIRSCSFLKSISGSKVSKKLAACGEAPIEAFTISFFEKLENIVWISLGVLSNICSNV